jgi:hypothetical protein
MIEVVASQHNKGQREHHVLVRRRGGDVIAPARQQVADPPLRSLEGRIPALQQ